MRSVFSGEKANAQRLLKQRFDAQLMQVPEWVCRRLTFPSFTSLSKRLFKIALSAGVILLRLEYGGFPSLSHKSHEGDCCWCKQWHLDSGSAIWLRRLSGGCWRACVCVCVCVCVSSLSGWHWLQDSDSCTFLQLYARILHDRKMLYRLARLLRLLGNGIWTCRHATHGMPEWSAVARATFLRRD